MVGESLPFRTISESQNELKQQHTEIAILDKRVDNWGGSVTERESVLAIRVTRRSDKIQDNRCSKPVRRCFR